ncbi:MAG: winged helix-turn-helix transcriptional regulator [Thermoleophilaceae bacterium]|nr:winged helix-turn-helix transcriptional regulator [Thermoleophilaceae bacterium]
MDEKRKEIDSRLRELRPLVDEYNRLEQAAAALAGLPAKAVHAVASAPRRRRGSAPAAKGRRGRPRGSGARSRQALELVRAKPGITIAELADAMGIKANYLYRVLPNLAAEGQVKRKGKGWHPA